MTGVGGPPFRKTPASPVDVLVSSLEQDLAQYLQSEGGVGPKSTSLTLGRTPGGRTPVLRPIPTRTGTTPFPQSHPRPLVLRQVTSFSPPLLGLFRGRGPARGRVGSESGSAQVPFSSRGFIRRLPFPTLGSRQKCRPPQTQGSVPFLRPSRLGPPTPRPGPPVMVVRRPVDPHKVHRRFLGTARGASG